MPGTAALAVEIIKNKIRVRFGDQPKYSAMPPITPAIILWLRERCSLFSLSIMAVSLHEWGLESRYLNTIQMTLCLGISWDLAIKTAQCLLSHWLVRLVQPVSCFYGYCPFYYNGAFANNRACAQRFKREWSILNDIYKYLDKTID